MRTMTLAAMERQSAWSVSGSRRRALGRNGELVVALVRESLVDGRGEVGHGGGTEAKMGWTHRRDKQQFPIWLP